MWHTYLQKGLLAAKIGKKNDFGWNPPTAASEFHSSLQSFYHFASMTPKSTLYILGG